MESTMHKRTIVALAAALAPMIAAVSTQAATVDLIAPMHGLVLMDPKTPPPAAGPLLYGATSAAPNWNITQWDIPAGKLPPFSKHVDGIDTIWTSHAPAASVQLTEGGGRSAVQLQQDGTVLPCMVSPTWARELDLFLGPNAGLQKRPPAVTGMPLLGASNPSLAEMTHLNAMFTVGVSWGLAASRKNCRTNQGSALFSVVLNDSHTHPGQTIFYQLNLAIFCFKEPIDLRRSCHHPPSPAHHALSAFQTKNPFGFDDILPSFDAKPASPTAPAALKIDLLPALIGAVSKTTGNGDHNPADWVVGGVYMGQHIWGDVTLQSSWSGISLQADTR